MVKIRLIGKERNGTVRTSAVSAIFFRRELDSSPAPAQVLRLSTGTSLVFGRSAKPVDAVRRQFDTRWFAIAPNTRRAMRFLPAAFFEGCRHGPR
jgi:hypothetical protein